MNELERISGGRSMPQLNRLRLYRLAVLALLFVPVLSCAKQEQGQAQSKERTLPQLRNELAMRYFDAASHVELAKHFHDQGKHLMAFYVLETARRYRFEEAEFNAAFRSVFGGVKPFDSSQAVEEALLKEHARDPNSIDTNTKLANIYAARKDWARAKEYISKTIQLKPDDYENTWALAEVLRREGNLIEAERVVRDYALKYPESPNGYRFRIDALIEKQHAKAKPIVQEAMSKFPKDGTFVFDLGNILHREGKLKEAEEQFVRAAQMSPESVLIQSWVGRFFHKVKKDDRRALDYYLNAYFLDPHAYESEYVESRIQKINAQLSEAEYQRQVKSGVPLAKILEDPNPMIATIAVEEMGKKWEPAHLKTYLELMGHDDGGVRWYATMAIAGHVDRSFDETLKALLRDGDLRKRGLAAYIAASLWKQESFEPLRSMLREEAQLLRFDAISALLMMGGPEGRKIVSEHLTRETHPKIKKLIESAMKRETVQPD
jgi:tetratricopeptide (TPR) repeat protein